MKAIKFYVVGSMCIGIFQIIDGILLCLNQMNACSLLFSLAEMIWVPWSVWAIIAFSKNSFPKLTPILYVLYNVSGWIFGVYLVSLASQTGEPIQIPFAYKIFGTCFGVYFFTANRLLLINKINKNA